MLKNKKYLLVIDSIILIGSLTSLFLLTGYSQPLVTAPLENEKNPLFIIPNANYISLDNNIKFNSPRNIFINEEFVLEPEKYFIKFSYDSKTEIRELGIETKVKLKLVKIDENSLGLYNAGDSDLDIETYNVGLLVNKKIVYGGNE